MDNDHGITDELRRFITDPLLGYASQSQHIERLTAIADRIDAEHHAAIRELNNLADASVLLPVDADGEIIHVGDMMERGEARGHVIALMLSEYPKKWGRGLHWGVQLEGEQAPTALDAYFRHYHKPTVEDVLRDMHAKLDEVTALYVGEAIDSDERDRDVARIFAEYTSKLRLAGEGE